MVDLGTLGGTFSRATAVNNLGQVVGTSETASGEEHAFSWTAAGGMVDLSTLGGQSCYVYAVNDLGQVVGTSETASRGEWHAFSWTASGGMVDLGTLGGESSRATAVNNLGQAAGWSHTASGWAHTTLWTVGPGIADSTPPICEHTRTEPGPPRSYEISVQDKESGLAAIIIEKVANFSVDVQPFAVGTTEPVIVTATKIQKSQSSFLALAAVDVVGNITQFDPADEPDNSTLVPSSSGGGSGGCFIVTVAGAGMGNGGIALCLVFATAAVAAIVRMRSAS
jgi:probable HAF family extracellular repeat protein